MCHSWTNASVWTPNKRFSFSAQICLPKSPISELVACVTRGHEEKREAPGMAYSLTKAHLQGDNLMDVVDSAFSIHNLYGILSSKVQMHNECLS